MFRKLDYQTRCFEAVDRYLAVLNERRDNADKVAEVKAQQPDIDIPDPDFPAEAFEQLKSEGILPASRANIPFSARHDGIGRSVPNITLKVPTAGGKTYIAVKAATKILNSYIRQHFGFILWIVPNEAIYTQTVKNFKNREHPCRLALDRAAAGRVKILEKTDRLNAADVDTHLCVMVLMLQSGNRKNKEVLRMFRDRGDVHGFVPPEGEQDKHRDLLTRIPNLDIYESHPLARARDKASTAEMIQRGDPGLLFTHVKDSLGNALRLMRPIVVMDEGHKAVSDLAYDTLYGFNPSFVLELTATPKYVEGRCGKTPRPARYANLLVEITGKELDAEGMIKMPLVLTTSSHEDWRSVLNAAVDKLNELKDKAETFEAETNRYIRPVLVVQVERTGKDTRDGSYIHAEDVKDWLITTGFDEAEIAIKSAEKNDLKQPENQNLLSPQNRVRVIITREALKEGWDCPFAYVLCSLASYSNLDAMTQLVGRILRQPHALKTGATALDQAYIFTHKSETATVIEQVKKRLEEDGLGDLAFTLSAPEKAQTLSGLERRLKRRDAYRHVKIALPELRVQCDGGMRYLDYETDILAKTDWTDFDLESEVASISMNRANMSQVHYIDLETARQAAVEPELKEFDPVLAVNRISHIILNPFVARGVIAKLITALEERGYDSLSMGTNAADIIETLCTALNRWQNSQAETHFKQAVTEGQIQFRLRVDGQNWDMPKYLITTESPQSQQVVNAEGQFLTKNLFEAVYAADMNQSEKDVAIWLDGQDTLGWWHRNLAKHHYGLQGWEKQKIYPDFICSMLTNGKTKQLCVLEMKGEHLAGNARTEYIRNILDFLTSNFEWDNTQDIGQLEFQNRGETVVCKLVSMDGWKDRLSGMFAP